MAAVHTANGVSRPGGITSDGKRQPSKPVKPKLTVSGPSNRRRLVLEQGPIPRPLPFE